MKGILRWALLAAIAVAAGVLAGEFLLRPKTIPMTAGTLVTPPRPIVDFTLQNADGGTFTNRDLLGHWTVIFPGFTFCPDVCPTTLTELKAVRAKLSADADADDDAGGDGVGDRVRIVFLSIDPARDTPEKLRDYVKFFDSEFVAATGPDPMLEKLGTSIGYVYAKVPGATPETYLMDHSTALILINPEGMVAGYFTPPFKPAAMAADLRALSGEAG